MEKHMEKDSTPQAKDLLISANGKMTYSTDKEKNRGLTQRSSKGITQKEKNTETGGTNMQTGPFMRVNGLIILSQVKGPTLGPTVKFTLENGKIIIWKVKAYLPGKTAEDTKENIKKTRNMDSEFIRGKMVDSTLVSGKMVSSMGKAYIET